MDSDKKETVADIDDKRKRLEYIVNVNKIAFRFGLILLLLLILARIGTYYVMNSIVDNRTEDFIAEVEKQGGTLDIQSIDDPKTYVKKEENAATGILYAIHNIKQFEEYLAEKYSPKYVRENSYSYDDPTSYGQRPQMYDDLKDWLEVNKKVLDVLSYFLYLDEVNFENSFSKIKWVSVDQLRLVSDLLYRRMFYSLKKKDLDSLFNDWYDYTQYIINLKDQHFTEITLMKINSAFTALNFMFIMLNNYDIQDYHLMIMIDIVNELTDVIDIHQAFSYDRIFFYHYYIKEQSEELIKWKKKNYGFKSMIIPDSVVSLDVLELLRFINICTKTTKLPLYKWRMYKQELQSLTSDYTTNRFFIETRDYRFIISDLLENYPKVNSAIEQAKALLAIELYKWDFGKYPDKLDDLVDEEILDKLPTDWVNNIPLTYVHDDFGYKVYSMWWDGIDDNGQSKDFVRLFGILDFQCFGYMNTSNLQTQPQTQTQAGDDVK